MHNPPHPGEFLTEIYLEPNGISGRSSEGWLAMQDAHDLWQARQRVDLDTIGTLDLAAG